MQARGRQRSLERSLIAVRSLAMHRHFSDRHGYQAPEKDISVREDAPPALRVAVCQLAAQAGMSYGDLRKLVCEVLLVQPNSNISAEGLMRDEMFMYLESCDWFKVYDIAEAIYAHLGREYAYYFNVEDLLQAFEAKLNQFFREQGIGWQMKKGNVQYRGSEAFTKAVEGGEKALLNTGRSQAASELNEAVRDISRRPPDITGAVQHAMAALESTARDVTGQPNPTFGQLIGSLKLKKPLGSALEKLWGYASNEARHGSEHSSLDATQAELIVGVCGAVCGFLAKTK